MKKPAQGSSPVQIRGLTAQEWAQSGDYPDAIVSEVRKEVKTTTEPVIVESTRKWLMTKNP